MSADTAGRQIWLCSDEHGTQAGDWQVVLWSGFSEDASVVSLVEMVERQEADLKQRYFRWLDQFASRLVDGVPVHQHLRGRAGFSYWWSTLLAERSSWKSPSIFKVFRLLALEGLHQEHRFESLTCAVSDPELLDLLRHWCRREGIRLELAGSALGPVSNGGGSVYQGLPHWVQALLNFVRLAVRGMRVRAPRESGGAADAARPVGFVSYLFNLDVEKARNGDFQSAYWSALPSLLDQLGIPSRWLHIHVRGRAIPDTATAVEVVNCLNRKGSPLQTHILLESVFSPRVGLGMLRDYVALVQGYRRVRAGWEEFTIPGSRLSIWPILQQDWKTSVIGKIAMDHCFFYNCFEAYFGTAAKQSKLFYLMEGQGWERCLLHSWRSNQREPSIGVPHATIKDWDLRFAQYSEAIAESNGGLLPDLVAANGPAAVQRLVRHGVDPGRIRMVEGLRYLDSRESMTTVGNRQFIAHDAGLRVLLLGESQERLNIHALGLMSAAAGRLPAGTSLLFKAHPLCFMDLSAWPNLSIERVQGTMGSCVNDYDIAVTSSCSSAAVDAYSAGKPVISIQDPEGFNMSPLRGMQCVRFVSTAEALLHEIKAAIGVNSSGPASFFKTEPALPAWRSLLEQHAGAPRDSGSAESGKRHGQYA